MDYKYLDKKFVKHNLATRQRKPKFPIGRLIFVTLLLSMITVICFQAYEAEHPNSAQNLTSITEVDLRDEPQELPPSLMTKINSGDFLTPSTNMSTPPPPLPAITWEEVKVEKGDTLVAVLSNYKISRTEVHRLLLTAKTKKLLTNLKPGQLLKFSYNRNYQIQVLTHYVSSNRIVTFTRNKDKFDISIDEKKPETRQVRAKGVIEQSMYEAAKKAKIPEKVTYQLAQLFKSKINFGKDLRPGDYFIVLYEQDYIGDKKHDVGNIIAAEFVSHDKSHKLVRFKTDDGFTRYYSPTGESLQKAFMKLPLLYKRISSPFNPRRKHPILHITRPHWGVDLSAASGTPVKASADGKITFFGRKGGYGNLVIIDHGHSITTWYAHLKKMAPKLKPGVRVKQGQTIGYVGSTGLASGPHLHYEYRVNNTPKNPMTVKFRPGNNIPTSQMARFKATANQLMAKLYENDSSTVLAKAETASTQS